MEDVTLKAFLAVSSDSGSGYGYGSGSGYGSGYGYGYGDGYGYGSGSGYGYGYGSGYGDGDGYGSGSGYGYGSGSGYGYGSGSGYGDGDGYGYGYGYGYGDGLKSYAGEAVNYIDGVPTVITSVRGNVAKGFIIRGDLTPRVCFVTKQDNYFAHGETLREAMAALRDKLFEDMPEDERIATFMSEHEWDRAYPAQDFFDWHHRLTGSCLMGREAFVRDEGLDMNAEYTTREFVELTWNAYGGDVIKKIPAAYGF